MKPVSIGTLLRHRERLSELSAAIEARQESGAVGPRHARVCRASHSILPNAAIKWSSVVVAIGTAELAVLDYKYVETIPTLKLRKLVTVRPESMSLREILQPSNIYAIDVLDRNMAIIYRVLAGTETGARSPMESIWLSQCRGHWGYSGTRLRRSIRGRASSGYHARLLYFSFVLPPPLRLPMIPTQDACFYHTACDLACENNI